jgi:hypothetical protein
LVAVCSNSLKFLYCHSCSCVQTPDPRSLEC